MKTFTRLYKIAKKLRREFIIPSDFYVAMNDNEVTETEMLHKKFRMITPNTK